jgi:type I restriction enzyme, R subunit
MLFKTRLGRFVRVYNYIAQLIFFDDAELENFASFTRLLAKRLQGVAPEQIDLSALVMTGYEIKPEKMPDGIKEDLVLEPINPDDGTGNDREKEFLKEIINLCICRGELIRPYRRSGDFNGSDPARGFIFSPAYYAQNQ